MLSVWMSPADGARLFHAALTAEDVGHTVVYGSSANTRLWWDLSTARALGYEPQDDSEPYAANSSRSRANWTRTTPTTPTWAATSARNRPCGRTEAEVRGHDG